jgi:parallel beta-helix repeat protein
MKKLFFFLILIYPVTLFAQPANGDGSLANPYSGLITTPWTLTGTKWCGDLQVTSGTFTVSAGAILQFSTGANLTISGTGVLSAVGTNTQNITFTASGASWGHLLFDNNSASVNSLLTYCNINKGDVSSFLPSDSRSYGGGIYSKSSKLEITNCIIENNKAQWGGGIFAGVSASPMISNCQIRSNSALQGGGGLYFWESSSSIVTNCIIESNSCSGNTYGGGGIFIGYSSLNVRIINCIILNNTATNVGNGIYFLASGNARIINSILWGSDNQIYFNNTATTVMQYSGVQGASYTTCLNLNSDNNASDGPNFNATNGSDWSIKFKSPCRDAGMTPSPTVPNDYLGKSRIGPYDIGAYEVQYSRWTGATNTSWATPLNWDESVDPSTGTGDVIIPTGLTNYPVDPFNPPDFTIGSSKQMIVESGARVTLDQLTNDGMLKLNHDASGFASLIINSYNRGTGAEGKEEIQLYLTGGGSALLEDYKWHYISTPVSSLSTDIFTGVTQDLAHFVESRVSSSLLQGWVAFDGFAYSGGTGPGFSSLTPGKGYNFWDGVNNTFTFDGLLNTSNSEMSLEYNGVPENHGFNLLGNPFSSGLDWNQIVDGTHFAYPTNTSKGVYFTQNNEQCSYNNGVGIPSTVTGIIPPMQGFFTKTYAIGKSITLPAAARTHSGIHARYKGKAVISLVRLQLSKDTVNYDETVVRFDEMAKTSLDNDFDALKMFISNTKNQIYTSLAGTDYSINGQPFPMASSPEVPAVIEIPVVVNLTATGNYKISAIQFQGLETGFNVTLLDNTTGFTVDLKTTPEVVFSSSAGTFTDRFKLFVSLATAIGKPESSKSIFNIYPYNGMINVVPLADDWTGKSGSVNILDITGKYTGNIENIEFQKNEIVQLPAPEIKGLYFIEVRSGVNRYVGKIVIK